MASAVGAEIDKANEKAVQRILAAGATLVDTKPAIKAIHGFKDDLVTYAGPPIEWDRMCRTQKIAITNLIIYEGLAKTSAEAEKKVRRGDVRLEPNHKYDNVSGMCGATSASLPVLIFENRVHGNRATDWMQTDLTSFGQKYDVGISEIRFIQRTLAPVMKATIRAAGGVDVKDVLATGLRMGDELHSNFDACRGILLNRLLPFMVRTGFSKKTLGEVGDYFASNHGRWYCGNLMMGACKVMMDAGRDMKYSSVVTAMARNGVEFGVQLSCLGDQWFTGPAGEIKGFTFPGFREEDSTRDIGDSAISESRGFGGTATPAAPAHARWIGEDLQDAINHTEKMREVSVDEDPLFRIPYLGRGVPVGIDVRKVVKTGTLPRINTGMAHREGGHGLIGAGVAVAPLEPFRSALKALADQYA